MEGGGRSAEGRQRGKRQEHSGPRNRHKGKGRMEKLGSDEKTGKGEAEGREGESRIRWGRKVGTDIKMSWKLHDR